VPCRRLIWRFANCWGHRHGCYLGSCIVSPVSLLRCDVSNSQWNSHDIVTGIGTGLASLQSLTAFFHLMVLATSWRWNMWMFGPKIYPYPQLPALGNINQDSPTRSISNKMDESGHEIHRFTMIHQQKGGDSPSPSRRFCRSSKVRKSCVQD
jgi:hypothetical protein